MLANDKPYVTGDSLRVVNFGLPQNGSVELRPTGELVYRPFALFVGNDQFVYTMQDQTGRQASASSTTCRWSPMDQSQIHDWLD